MAFVFAAYAIAPLAALVAAALVHPVVAAAATVHPVVASFARSNIFILPAEWFSHIGSSWIDRSLYYLYRI